VNKAVWPRVSRRNHVVCTIGPIELLVYLLLALVAGLSIYFAFRGRVSSWLLIVLVLVLSPLVAVVLGQLLYVFLWTIL
jgi:hypothetical protein